MTSIPRWGASGRTGLPEQMPNGEWVKYADHLEAMGVHGTLDAHLPECPVEAMLAKGRTVAAQSCICERLRACEKRSTQLALLAAERAVQTLQYADPFPAIGKIRELREESQ